MRLRSLELATLMGVLGYHSVFVEGYDGSAFLQYTSCEDVVEHAAGPARINSCSCPHEPQCGECSETSDAFATTQTVLCYNSCVYCLDSSQSECGIFAVQTSLSETATYAGVGGYSGSVPFIAGYYTYSYVWTYNTGPQTGSSFFLQLQKTKKICSAGIDQDNLCASCQVFECTDGSLQASIDCTNLEAGATSTACNGVFGEQGWTTLDASAVDGILKPLIIPYDGCRAGSTVLEMTEEAVSTMDTETMGGMTMSPAVPLPVVTFPTFSPSFVSLQPISDAATTTVSPATRGSDSGGGGTLATTSVAASAAESFETIAMTATRFSFVILFVSALSAML